MQNTMQTAFRFHMRNARPALHYAQGVVTWTGTGKGIAVEAIARARADVAAKTVRYPAPIKGQAMRGGFDKDKPESVFVDDPAAYGLRFVGRVEADTRRAVWDNSESSGWYADTCGHSTIFGVVYQLPARKGMARFVAGYSTSDNDTGALLDFGRIYESADHCSYDGAQGNDAARAAAYCADSMAQHAAESARDHDAAWRAGNSWADEQEGIKAARQEALAILKERRALKGQAGFPALCKAIAAQVASLRHEMQEARDRAAQLAEGEAEGLYFWAGDKALRESFCEGAGLEKFPA